MKRFFVIIALLASLVPVAFTIYYVGGWDNFHGIPPKGATDSLYYYARIHEVADGNPLNGNPYIYEYRKAFAPAFFLPDIISALPLLIGFPLSLAIIINIFIWSFVFLMLTFTFLKLISVSNKWAIFWSIFTFIISYTLILRPTVMQIIYPLFLLFFIVLIKFLYEPYERRRIIWLSVIAASTFYAYTYLAYLVFLTLAFIFLWFLYNHRFKELRSLTTVGIYTAFLLIPFGIYTWMQMQDPYYFETLSRIGLVYTHVPATEAFLYGRWVVVVFIILTLLWLFSKKEEDQRVEISKNTQKIFLITTGVSLLMGLFLNVFTGVELQLATHIGRFVILWMTLILGVFLHQVYKEFSFQNLKTKKTKYIIIGIFLLLLTVGVLRNFPRSFTFFKFNDRWGKTVATQSYGIPLKWLEDNISEQSVIWSNESIAEYISVITKHYPLFFSGAVLHTASAQELEDRYLLSRGLNSLTIEDLKLDYGLYAGAKPLKEEEYFNELFKRYETIKKNPASYLEQFNVKYLIIDRDRDNLEGVSIDKAVYDDGRFVVLPTPL